MGLSGSAPAEVGSIDTTELPIASSASCTTPTNPKSLSFDAVGAIYEDGSGALWVGTGDMESKDAAGGLNRFDRSTGEFTRFQHDPEDSTSISSDVIFDIEEDAQGPTLDSDQQRNQ